MRQFCTQRVLVAPYSEWFGCADGVYIGTFTLCLEVVAMCLFIVTWRNGHGGTVA